jgi:Tol biopolymer transport system component
MTDARRRQLDQLFAEAIQHAPDARAEFVARTCGDDDGLRADVLSLLQADSSSGEFLASTALDELAREFSADGWSLRAGERVGAYVVDRLLGSGGSGEVWRARDERLDRDVAIKVLLPHYARDAERLRRFAEEARAAGGINHSNILAVYDVGEHRGAPFLVSECLEGESLRKRLNAGPLPPDQALAVALAIARGLAAAHARGIVHRDLKPDNVFLRSDGVVKILDFGLAKLTLPIDPRQAAGSHTVTGVIVGTAAYMAPEQVRGETVDARADLFALGTTLHEMLRGERPFSGASIVETMHAILTTEPPNLSSVNRQVPRALATIVARLLKKAPEARFQSAADLVWALEQVAQAPTDIDAHPAIVGESAIVKRPRWLPWALLSAAAVVFLAGAWSWRGGAGREPDAMPLIQAVWTLPPGTSLDSAPVVSPDGQHVAFVGADASGSRLFVRNRAASHAVVIPGTEGAKHPFWSPDSRSLAFFARGQLMRVLLAGGAVVAVTPVFDARGGSWSPSGTIVFSPDLMSTALMKVPDRGGPVEAATLLDRARGDNSHRWPAFLPDGVHFLYFVRAEAEERRGVYVGRVDRPAAVPGEPLFQSESEVVYVPAASGRGLGDLLYVRNGRIEARPFDANRVALAGDPRTLDLRAGELTPYHSSLLSASAGLLAFGSSRVPFGMLLASVDRSGANLQVEKTSEPQGWPRLAPDGRLARQRIDPIKGNGDIWVDLGGGRQVRVTTAPGPHLLPVWSPDWNRLAYVSGNPPGRPGERRLTIAAADGSQVLQSFPCPGGQDAFCEPTDWLPDDRLIVNVRGPHGGDIWVVSTDGDSAEKLLAEPYPERDGQVFGRWIAYVSQDERVPNVSVISMSGPRKRFTISGGGGDQPVWRGDGRELFFVDPRGGLRSVAVSWTPDGVPTFDSPVELPVPPVGFGHWGTQYDVSADGRRIYFMRRHEDQPPREINVITGWRSLLPSSR